MRKWLPVLGVVAASLLLLAGIASIVIANMTLGQASDAVAGARSLYGARTDVADAQQAIGRSNLKQALKGAIAANAAAERVRRTTEGILPLLAKAEAGSARTGAAASDTGRILRNLGEDAEQAARLLRSIAAEQRGSTTAAELTNSFLKRVLAALRKTNRSFPPR
jgi:hypothetical protein